MALRSDLDRRDVTAEAYRLHQSGLTQREIGKQLGISGAAVNKRLKKINPEGFPKPRPELPRVKVYEDYIEERGRGENEPVLAEGVSQRTSGSIKNILSVIPRLDNVEDMDYNELARFWNVSWNALLDAAIADLDLKLLDVLLTKFRSTLIKEKDPIVQILPIEYCMIPPPMQLNEVSQGIASAAIEMIAGHHLTLDDASAILSGLTKYYPNAEARD